MSIAREAEKHVVITRFNDLQPELPSLELIQSPEGLKTPVVDTDSLFGK